MGATGLVLDIRGGYTASGTPIQIFHSTGADNQQFEFTASGDIRNPASGKCINFQMPWKTDSKAFLDECSNTQGKFYRTESANLVNIWTDTGDYDGKLCFDIDRYWEPSQHPAEETIMQLFPCKNPISINQRWVVSDYVSTSPNVT